jgi:YVTN family beta-propeller protein
MKLKHVNGLIFLTLLFLVFSCSTPGTIRNLPPREGLAEVLVYLQPSPAQIRRVQWTMGELGVSRSDGILAPLTLVFRELKGSDVEGQQVLLAHGLVAPGSYNGVFITLQGASVTREDGTAALLVPDHPLEIAGSFDLGASEVLTLFLNLDGAGLVRDGFEFSPSFSLDFPSRDLTSLIGYLTLPQADRITIFNRKSLLITGALATGRTPQAITVDKLRGLAYVALSGEDAIQTLDVFQGVMRQRIFLRNGDKPVDLDLTSDGRVLVTANYASDTVSIVDPVLDMETERIQVERGPAAVIVNKYGTRAYVICSLSGTVSVVDLSTGTLFTSLPLDETTPVDAVLDRDEEKLFVISRDSPNLTVVDTSTLTVTDKIYVGMGAVSIVADDLSGLVLVGRKFGREIALIDPSALMPVDTIRLESAAGPMILDPQQNALLVSIPEKGVVQKVNLVSKKVISEMKTDLIPSEVAVVE